MAAHRYWRLLIEAINGSTVTSIEQLVLRTSIGGANVATGGTASASSVSGTDTAANAFDGNSATWWLSSGNVPQWLKYDFGAGNETDIVEMAVTARSGSTGTNGQRPVDFKLQYSDDDAAWATLIAVGGECDWVVSATRTYSADDRPDDPGVSGRAWRLNVSAIGGAANLTVNELRLYEAGNATDLTEGGDYYASTQQQGLVSQVFDNTDLSSYWMSRSTTGWVAYKLPAAKTVTVVGITAFRAGTPGTRTDAPKDFTIESWDGSAWQVAMTLTGITGWTDGQTRYFMAGGETTAPVGSSGRPQAFFCM